MVITSLQNIYQPIQNVSNLDLETPMLRIHNKNKLQFPSLVPSPVLDLRTLIDNQDRPSNLLIRWPKKGESPIKKGTRILNYSKIGIWSLRRYGSVLKL